MMRRRARRGGGVALLAALALLSAACGQKAGVAGSLAGSSSSGGSALGGGDGDTSLDGGAATTEGGGEAAAGGGGTARRGGGQQAGAGGAPAEGGAADGGAQAAGPLDRTGISDTEIRIGIHAPVTGAAAIDAFSPGVGVYSEWAGPIEGLGNRRMVVEWRDDKFDPAEARRVCKELVEVEKVFVLIGGAGVDQIKSCAEYAGEVGIPYFSPGVTEGPFKSLQGYFALSETYSQQNVQVGQLIKNQIQKTKLGIVLTDSPLLDETDASIRAEAQKNGIEIVGKTHRLAKNAGKSQTDAVATELKGDGAEVVYALVSPTVFGFLYASAKQQQYNPTYTAAGLSLGVNLVAPPICAAAKTPPAVTPDVRVFSPMVELDVIDAHDKDYKPAYRKKNPGREPDDIGILLWGMEKMLRLMMEADGPDLSRQTLMQAISSGNPFETNVYSPVKYGGVPHFGASSVTLLRLECTATGGEYKTAQAFGSAF